MAISTSSPLLKSSNFFCQIASNPTSVHRNPPNLANCNVKIRSSRLFAAPHCGILPFSARFRPRARRRNALRKKISPPQERQVRQDPKALEFDYKLEIFGSLDAGIGKVSSRSDLNHKLGSFCPSDAGIGNVVSRSNLDVQLENFGSLDAGIGNIESKSNFDVRKEVVRDSEMSEFWGFGTGPIFTIYEDSDGKVVRVEVDEDEIFARSETQEGEEFGDLELKLSCARAIAMEVERGERVVLNNSSLFEFVAVDGQKSSVVDAVASVVQRNEPILWNLPLSGFSLLCGCCIVWVAARLIWGDGNTESSRKEEDMLRRKKISRIRREELEKGRIKVLKNVPDIAGDSLIRPKLDRNELMNNIKRAKALRESLALSFVCSHGNAIDTNDAKIMEIRKMAREVHKLERENSEENDTKSEDYDVCSQPLAAKEGEVSARNSAHTQPEYLDNASDSRGMSEISLCDDRIKESMEHAVDLKNREAFVEISVKNLNDVQELEQSEPFGSDKKMTDVKDNAHMICTVGKGADVSSATDDTVIPSNINTSSSDLKNKEALAEMSVNNLDYIQEIEPSGPVGYDNQMIDAKENAHKLSTAGKVAHIGSETDDIVTPNNISTSSSVLKNNEALVDISAKNVNYIQEIEPSKTVGSEKQMSNGKDSAYNISIVGKEANIVSESADTVTPHDINASSYHLKNKKVLVEISSNNLNYIQEIEPSEPFGSDKQLTDAKDIANDTRTPKPSDLKNKEALVELRMNNLDSIEEIEQSKPFGNDKQVTDAKNSDHKISSAGKEVQIGLVTHDTATLDNTNILSSHVLSKEETFGQNETQISTLEEQKKSTSSKKSFVGDSVKTRPRITKFVKEARACLPKKQGKSQKDVCSDQEAKTRKLSQGVLESNTLINPSNNVQKAKSMTRKRLKKVRYDQGVQTRERAQEVLESSGMIDPSNNIQNAKRMRRKQLKNAHCNQGAETRELAQEVLEKSGVINLSENAQNAISVKPPGGTVSSVQGQPPKDAFREAKSNEFSATMIRKGETKLDMDQSLEDVEGAVVEVGSKSYQDKIVHERKSISKRKK